MYGMAKPASREALRIFRTLADPTRLRLLNLLAGGETCVCELTGTLRIVQPKVSRHLARLKQAGLVEARRDGKWMHYRWAGQRHPPLRRLLSALRDWMGNDEQMKEERRRREKICHRISREKTGGRNRK